MTFSELNIDQDMVDALATKGIVEPFPIQTQTIPLGLGGQDIIGQAKTGTGKTLGFGLPLLQSLGTDPAPGVKALVVVPTRELCVQVAEDLVLAASNRSTQIAAIYGGKAYEGQVEQLKAGAQVVVGTPGRLLDLASQRMLSLKDVKVMVLDEADKMLDLGFLSDIEKLFAQTPPTRHTMLFSATMPGPIVALARRFMNRPIHIRATDPNEGLTQANIKHVVYRAHNLDKDEVIARILQAEGRGKTVVFTRTKRAAAKLVEELNDRGLQRCGRARRPQPGAARARHGRVQGRQEGHPDRHGCRCPRYRRERRHPRDQPHHPRRRRHLPAPRRPHGPRRQDRYRRDVRRLGRHAQVDAHQPGARHGPAGTGGDLLVVAAPVHRPRHSHRHQGATQPRRTAACARAAVRPLRRS